MSVHTLHVCTYTRMSCIYVKCAQMYKPPTCMQIQLLLAHFYFIFMNAGLTRTRNSSYMYKSDGELCGSMGGVHVNAPSFSIIYIIVETLFKRFPRDLEDRRAPCRILSAARVLYSPEGF